MKYDGIQLEYRKSFYLLALNLTILILSIMAAYKYPVKGYEVSIYESTPVFYWIGISIVIFISIFVFTFNNNKKILFTSLSLSGLAILSIISLPIIRGYYFIGLGDSISHLGTSLMIFENNSIEPDLFYPSIHILSISITFVADIQIRTSMMILLPLLGAIFIFFIPLTLIKIHGKFNRKLIILGTFSAFFFLPINNISTYFQLHPSSQALLFLPLVLFLYLEYETIYDYRFLPLYSLSYLALIFFHPQQALSFLILMFLIVVFKKISHNKEKNGLSLNIPIITGILFWIWTGFHAQFHSTIETLYVRLVEGYGAPGEDVAERGVSLVQVGGSIEEVFLKLFGLTVFFIILTLTFILVKKSSKEKDMISYLFFAIFPIGLIVGMYIMMGQATSQAHRYVGFIQLILTITGVYGFFYLVKDIRLKKEYVINLFIIIGLIISVITIFPSPYTYQSTPHVTEMHYVGYDTTFNNYNETLNLGSVRMASHRYYRTTQLQPSDSYRRSQFEADPPDHFNNQSLTEYYEDKTYLAITESERIRDADLYRGFRFSHDDFEYLEGEPDIDKIYTNGGFDLYLVNV